MISIKYIKDDATQPEGVGNKLIVHICNDIGVWGKGFVKVISSRYSSPEKEYLDWYQSGDTFCLGEVQFVKVSDSIWVANMIAQKDLFPLEGLPPVRYEAVRKCLVKAAAFAIHNSCNIHMPRMGSGLAGGKWSLIEPIINEELITRNIHVTVYDLG